MPEGKSSRTLRSMLRLSRGLFRPLACGLLLLSIPIGCSKKDQAKCDEALATARQALKSGQEDLMRQWRDRGWKYCKDSSSVQALDKEIVDTQQAELQKKAAEEAEKKKLEQLGQTFVGWVGQYRAAPKGASAIPECPEVEKGQKEEERFCEAKRQAGPYEFRVRYWEAEPPAARFSLKPGVVMSCSHFGAAEVRSFNIPATGGQTAKRTLCQFSGGALSGMQLVLTNAVNADVHVFSNEYLTKDPGMKKYIGS